MADANNNCELPSSGSRHLERDWSADYGHWKLHQLKRELHLRGARTTGRKEDLVQRLRDIDRLQANPVTESIPAPVDNSFNELHWPTGVFRSVTDESKGDLPSIKDEHVESYVQSCQGHNVVVRWDNGTLKKAKHLLADNIEALSYFIHQDKAFFSACIGASMKKKVTYIVKLITTTGGEILQAACDCPSGTGPRASCKHICVTALAVVAHHNNEVQVCDTREYSPLCQCLPEICRDGKGDNTLYSPMQCAVHFFPSSPPQAVNIHQTCTDRLQSFHRPLKRHGGSPVRAEELTGQQGKDDDPRPMEFRQHPGMETMI